MGEKRYFNETEFRRDSARIVLLYKRSGYREVEVDMDVRYSGDDDVHLRFFIDEGDPVRVTEMEINGLGDIAEASDVLERLPLHVGDPFNLLLVQASQDSIGAYLRNRGYPFAEIFPNYNTTLAEYSATVRFTADPGPRARVAAIDVIGAQQIDEDVIRRAMYIQEGDWYSERDLYRSQIDLYRMNMFNLVDVGLADSTDFESPDTVVTVQVSVAEAALHSIRFGPGYGTVDCFRAMGAWTAYDFLGGGRSLDVSARISKLGASNATLQEHLCRALRHEPPERDSLNYTVTASLTEPFFFSRNVSASLSFTAERYSEVQAYLRRSVGGEVALTWRTPFNVPLTASYGLSRAITIADDAIFCFFLNVCQWEEEPGRPISDTDVYRNWLLRSEVGLSFSLDRSNSPLDPSRGYRLTGGLRHASEFLGSDSLVQFTEGMLEFSSYHRVARRGVFSWRVRLAAVHSPLLYDSDEAPYRFLTADDRLYGGGPNSVRGYSHNELGPIVRVIDQTFTPDSIPKLDALTPDSVTAYPVRSSATGGDRLVFANVEYRFPLPLFSGRVYGSAYVDAGMVYESSDSVATIFGVVGKHFRVTPGFGFRVASPLGPMRLDVGYNPWPPQESPQWYAEILVDPDTDSYELRPLPGLSGEAPVRSFFNHFRLHFSVGQAF